MSDLRDQLEDEIAKLDPLLRRAYIFLMLDARLRGRWPDTADIQRYARKFGVAHDDLGGLLGVLLDVKDGHAVRVDAIRDGEWFEQDKRDFELCASNETFAFFELSVAAYAQEL